MKKILFTIILIFLAFNIHAQTFTELKKSAENGNLVSQYQLGLYYQQNNKQELAVRWFQSASIQGFQAAQFSLALCLINGKGITEDKNLGINWAMKSAKQGFPFAQEFLATSYSAGYILNKDSQEAFNWWLRLANNSQIQEFPNIPGHLELLQEAQFEVGLCYAQGNGVAKDEKEALEWFTKASQLGNINAEYALGYAYMNGLGTKQDYQQAIKHYNIAANNGNIQSQFFLALLYHDGEGTKRNPNVAFNWMKKAADQGFIDAMNYVGIYYLTGDGTEKNSQKAYKYISDAANRNSDYASWILAKMYYNGDGVEKDSTLSIKWGTKAAELGNHEAEVFLGQLYEYGGGGYSQNNNKAIEWYTKAAEQNYPPAQTQLGWLYYKLKNYKDAYAWFTKATEVNYPEGYNGLAYCYFDGKGVSKDTDKALELINQAITLSNNEPRYLDTKGEFLYKIGQTDKAQDIYNKIQKEYPQYYTADKTTLYNFFNNKDGYNDVDQSIPMIASTNSNAFAIIIANEKYQREKDVPYATNDGKVFADYCQKTMGIPEKNIHLVQNATLNDIKYHLNWLKQVIDVYGKDSKVIIYYAGHGIPDEKSKAAYLLPVDGYGSDISTGYSLQELYQTLGQLQSKEVVAFLDACFSGTNRDGDMMQAARGVAIKVKEAAPKGNLVVFSASKEDETAYPYKEKQHGMFTYYLLKKLQESKGNTTLEDLCNYVTNNVRKQSIVEKGKLQTPTIFASPTLGQNWETWKLK